MDSDNELDIVEQAERTALEQDNLDEPQEIERDINEEIEDLEADEAEEDNRQTEKKEIKPKRVVKNPRVKLDAETLKGPRGLKALPALMEKQRFRGKGHEEHDLNVLLKGYKYWCHRMFPKMRFNQCIEKIESLSNKKPVLTYIKRIRMGLLDEESADEAGHNSEEETSVPPSAQEQQHIETVESKFDSFVQRQTQPVQVKETYELTEEQKETIRINKEKALKLRQERLRRIQEQAKSKLQTSSVLPSSDLLGESTALFESQENTQIDQESQETESQINSENLSEAFIPISQSHSKSSNTLFDDDDECFSTLVVDDNMQSQDLFDNTQEKQKQISENHENPDEIGVDDYLDFLQSGSDDYEAWKKQNKNASEAGEASNVNDIEMEENNLRSEEIVMS